MLTPITKVGHLWVKRDDSFRVAGVCGGKARTCLYLARRAQEHGATGLVTACNMHSPQAAIVAAIAQSMNMDCLVYVNKHSKPTPEVELARQYGARVLLAESTYDSVAELRAHQFVHSLRFVHERPWVLIPFGMKCQEAVEQTAKQVKGIPYTVKRIVVPVGSGMSLCGVLKGLQECKRDIPVLGVSVGRDPRSTIRMYGPKDYAQMCRIVTSNMAYGTPASQTLLGNIELDAIYEAKALPYLRLDDLFWCVGHRAHLEDNYV